MIIAGVSHISIICLLTASARISRTLEAESGAMHNMSRTTQFVADVSECKQELYNINKHMCKVNTQFLQWTSAMVLVHSGRPTRPVGCLSWRRPRAQRLRPAQR